MPQRQAAPRSLEKVLVLIGGSTELKRRTNNSTANGTVATCREGGRGLQSIVTYDH